MGHEYGRWQRCGCGDCTPPTFWQEWRTLFLLLALIAAMLGVSVYVAIGELDLPLRPAAVLLPFAVAALDHGPPRQEPRRLPAPRMAPSRPVPLAPWRMRRLWWKINRDMAPYGLGHMALREWRTHTPLAREIALAVAIEHMRGHRG